jgi:hypothetical protein
MKNHYMFTVADSEEPSYHSTYIMHHPTRSDSDLRRDYKALLDAHSQSEEWCVGDVMRSLEKLGWVIVIMPEVRVTY